MSQVRIQQIKIGQELNSSIYNSKGRLLFTEGTILDQNKIDIMRTWGVVKIDIKGDVPVNMEEFYTFDNLPFKTKEEILKSLLIQFKNCDLDHPLIKELVNYQRLKLVKTYQLSEKAS